MSDLLALLRDYLPAEIIVISGIFIYLLLLFRKLAEEFVTIAEKQASLAETQAQYIQQRLEVVEKTLGISDKAFDLQEKRITILQELEKEREARTEQSEKALEVAREELRNLDRQYQEAVTKLDLRAQQAQELKDVQHRLKRASRTEAIAEYNHALQTRLQVALAHADNLKSEVPKDSRQYERIEDILEAIEETSRTIADFTQ